MRENIKKFFSYLGFNDTTINEKQILILIYLLTQFLHYQTYYTKR